MNTKERQARIKFVSTMFIYGTIGVFARYIQLPSSMTALVRGIIGAVFLFLIIKFQKRPLDKEAIKNNLGLLLASGFAIGLNWIALFESYRYTTVATATLCYYMAPVFIIIASPFVLKERITVRKLLCVFVALFGMFFVSGVFETGIPDFTELKGVFLGLVAAVLYASVTLMNKKMKPIPSYEQTFMQLGSSTLIVLPYMLLTENVMELSYDARSIIVLLFMGVVHTGIAYAIWFDAIKDIPAQTAANLSYIDPVVAILLSALFLKEPMSVYDMAGAVMILGSTMISELPEKALENKERVL